MDHADDRHLADPEFLDHFVEHQLPSVCTFTLTIRQKVVIVTEQLYPTSGPAQSVYRSFAEPVENGGDTGIGHHADQGRDQRSSFRSGIGFLGIAPAASHPGRNVEDGMVTAMPVDHAMQSIVFDPHHNLADQGPGDSLLDLDRRGLVVPNGRQVSSEIHKSFPLGGAQLPGGIVDHSRQLRFQALRGHQPFVPPPLQFSCHQPIVGINGIVLSARQPGFVTGCF